MAVPASSSAASGASPFIRSRKHAAPALGAAALVALHLPLSAHAQTAEPSLAETTVRAAPERDFNPQNASSPKFTAPLIDTPKTVQVIPEQLLRETNASSLQSALRAVPGITFGNGEGGNPNGDQPFIRGSDAQSSTYVDGMRDIAAGTRDTFNIESIEVIKGADSAYAGRGGAGGSIDITTKRAKADNFFQGDAGLGTDRYKRATIDLNRVVAPGAAVRLNAMAHDADIPGRDGPKDKRWGLAPTVTVGMDGPTQFTLAWQHLQTDGMPDGGVPWRLSNTNAARLPGGSIVRPIYGDSRENWYGLKSRDYEKEKSDLVTATFEHRFSASARFRNSLRFSKSSQDYLWTQPDDSQGNAANGYVYRRGNLRDATTRTVQNVSEFTGEAQTGRIGHRYAVGLELAHEKSRSQTAVPAPPSTVCRAASVWCATLDHPDSSPAWTAPVPLGLPATSRIDTAAVYGFDTLKFNEQWLLNGGVRLDHYRLKTAGPAGRANPAYDLGHSDTIANYQLGLVFKPAPSGSIYASIGTSSRPGGSALGNGNEDLGVTTPELADLKPEKTRSIEVGTKWDVMDQRLTLTAALFRNNVTNVRITENGVTYMGGDKVVNGVELGVSGRVLPGLTVFGGYTFMDSEQKNMGVGSVANGRPYANTPRHSLSLWSSYKPTQQLTFGLGVTAQSHVNQGYVRSSLDQGVVTKRANGYARFDAMVAYQFTRNLALQLNVYNLTDRVYYTGIRSPHYATIAPGRSAVASLKFTY